MEYIKGRKIFHLKRVTNFILDEADRLLQKDFEREINIIISELPHERQCYLFSASKINLVSRFNNIKLRNPVKIFINKKKKLCFTLMQNYVFLPLRLKDAYIVHLCNEFFGCSIVIFAATRECVEKITLLLRLVGFNTKLIHGEIVQTKRLEAISQFKSKEVKILVTTDLASRGLDIFGIDLVINYDLPMYVKNYLHRVGRTARSGQSGRAISLVTQYDVRSLQRIEKFFSCRLKELSYDAVKIVSVFTIIKKAKRIINSLLGSGKNYFSLS